jgi:hypothetical protein
MISSLWNLGDGGVGYALWPHDGTLRLGFVSVSNQKSFRSSSRYGTDPPGGGRHDHGAASDSVNASALEGKFFNLGVYSNSTGGSIVVRAPGTATWKTSADRWALGLAPEEVTLGAPPVDLDRPVIPHRWFG